MSNYGQKAALALSLLILIALSVTEVVLKLASTNFIAEQEGTTFQYTDSSSFEQHLYALPESLHRETINYVVGAGITSIVIAVLALIYLASHVSDPFTSLRPTTALAVFVVLAINAILAVSGMIALNAIHGFSANYDREYNLTPSAYVYDMGKFDLETWVCEVGEVKSLSKRFGEQCHLERAGRLVSVAWMLVACVVVGVAAWVFWGALKQRDTKEGAQVGKWWLRSRWESRGVKEIPMSVRATVIPRPYSSQYRAAYCPAVPVGSTRV